MTLPDWELVVRLAVAAGLGTLLGLEREWRAHPAGLSTHALVAVGAALFTMAGAYGFGDLPQVSQRDPARVAAQVATGIGFIGAGAIIKTGALVRGVTTAATVWLAGALGVAAGVGAYVAAVVAAALVMALLVGHRAVEGSLMRTLGWAPRTVRVEYERGHGTLGPILAGLEQAGVRVERLRLVDEDGDGEPPMRTALVQVATRDDGALDALVQRVASRREVVTAEVVHGKGW
ncbi:MAG: MgtC/SapB family protein [Actinomycetota bacterium]